MIEHLLKELLAVIHRDGGHYVSKHGFDKAVSDAIDLVIEERLSAIEIAESSSK